MDAGLEIHALTPTRQADFLAFFDGEAFADNPRWGFCYCQFLLVDHRVVQWSARGAAENREAACTRIACGQMQGWLAYREGRVIGWCHAGPRRLFAALDDTVEPEAAQMGQIGCFVIARPYRRQGVATALLQAALAGLKAQGLRLVEAMPATPGTVPSDAREHFGPRAMFERAGFLPHRLDDDGSKLFMRREL